MKEAADIVLEVQVTEKGTDLASKHNKYIFRVARSANKIEIKRAIEGVYGVSVAGVNTLNYTGKRKRERTIRYGKRADWKRAIVTLKAGDTIEAA